MGQTKSRMKSPTEKENNGLTCLRCLDSCRNRRLQSKWLDDDTFSVEMASAYDPNEDNILPWPQRSTDDDHPYQSAIDTQAQSSQTMPSENPVEDTVRKEMYTDPRNPNDETKPKDVSDRGNPNEETTPKDFSDPKNPNEETKPKDFADSSNPNEETKPKDVSDWSKPIEETEPKMLSGGYIQGRMGPEGESNPSSFSPSAHTCIICGRYHY